MTASGRRPASAGNWSRSLLRRLCRPGPAAVFVLALAASAGSRVGGMSTSADSPPVYRVPLRVHLGKSGRPLGEWPPIMAEINRIWTTQAAICFDIHTVDHDEELAHGLDLWFEATIPHWNGYYSDPNDMHVRDQPELAPAPNPTASAAARTAAHEIGHALWLRHRQDSDDNLMRSKTNGWQLNQAEIETVRRAALLLAPDASGPLPCGPSKLHSRP